MSQGELSAAEELSARIEVHVDRIAGLIDRRHEDASVATQIEKIVEQGMAEIAATEQREPDDPETAEVAQGLRAYMIGTRGLVAWWRGNHREAMGLLEESVQLADDIAYTQAMLGAVYGDAGNFDAALQHTRRAQLLEPDNPQYAATVELLERRRMESSQKKFRGSQKALWALVGFSVVWLVIGHLSLFFLCAAAAFVYWKWLGRR